LSGTIPQLAKAVRLKAKVSDLANGNEIKGIVPLLADLLLEGRVVTMDALLAQREIAQTIVEKGGTT